MARKNNCAAPTPAFKPSPHDLKIERLVAVAFIRDGETHHGFRSHYELRSSLGDAHPADPKRGDVPGFWTSFERFVTRDEAKLIGEVSGQCRPQQRELLSSDVKW
jgi:hypothetical protein